MERYTIDIAVENYAGAHIQNDPSRRGQYWCCLHFDDMDAATSAQQSFRPSGKLVTPEVDPETQASIDSGREFMAKLLADIPPGTPLDKVKFVVAHEEGGIEFNYTGPEATTHVDDKVYSDVDFDADTAKIIRDLTAKPNLPAVHTPEPAADFLPGVMTPEQALAILASRAPG